MTKSEGFITKADTRNLDGRAFILAIAVIVVVALVTAIAGLLHLAGVDLPAWAGFAGGAIAGLTFGLLLGTTLSKPL